MGVGDYVRTKYGIIAKIIDVIEDLSIDCDRDIYYENGLSDSMPMMEIPYNLKDEYVIKSSPSIIDLIEVGDYVNGVIVTQSYIDNIKHIAPEIKENNYGIKSIVTKECFESMEYKVGEE